jgi:hypothetical protein
VIPPNAPAIVTFTAARPAMTPWFSAFGKSNADPQLKQYPSIQKD